MKRLFIIPLVLLGLTACNSEDKEIYTRVMKIESIPAGAPIVVDGLRIGKTPVSLDVETNEYGCFVRKTVVTAIPHQSSLQTQVKTFPAYTLSDPAKSEVPEKIIFDLTKLPSDSSSIIISND